MSCSVSESIKQLARKRDAGEHAAVANTFLEAEIAAGREEIPLPCAVCINEADAGPDSILVYQHAAQRYHQQHNRLLHAALCRPVVIREGIRHENANCFHFRFLFAVRRQKEISKRLLRAIFDWSSCSTTISNAWRKDESRKKSRRTRDGRIGDSNIKHNLKS